MEKTLPTPALDAISRRYAPGSQAWWDAVERAERRLGIGWT